MTYAFKLVKKLLSKLFVRKTSYIKEGINPSHDWYIILIFTFIFICVSAIISSYLYFQINQGDFFASDKNNPVKTVVIDNNLLRKTIDEINSREKKFEEFKLNKFIPPDPSI